MSKKQKYLTEFALEMGGAGLLFLGDVQGRTLWLILGWAAVIGGFALENIWFRCPRCKRYPPRKKYYFGRFSCPYCGQAMER